MTVVTHVNRVLLTGDRELSERECERIAQFLSEKKVAGKYHIDWLSASVCLGVLAACLAFWSGVAWLVIR